MRSNQRKGLIQRQEIAYKAPSGGLEPAFWHQNRRSKRTNAARQPLFSTGPHLAHNAPLPPKKFLLKFARDRQCYLRWVFEAKKRFGLSVLDYMVTCNHFHLLIKDTGPNVIAKSMQLIAGRTGQEYNQHKRRQGAFWEDRYHATAIQADEHLHQCVVYIDLNMVRAGVVKHPREWEDSGYCEIQKPPSRYKNYRFAGIKCVIWLCRSSAISANTSPMD